MRWLLLVYAVLNGLLVLAGAALHVPAFQVISNAAISIVCFWSYTQEAR